jgi:ankyrin repeat protein
MNHVKVMNGREAIVKLLIETDKVDVDSEDEHGRTPLLWAAMNGYEVVVTMLLDTSEVEVDLKDQHSKLHCHGLP